MKDFLDRVYQLLGKKRKAPEDNSAVATSKKLRLSNNNFLEGSSHDDDSYRHFLFDQVRGTNRRQTIDPQMSNNKLGTLFTKYDEQRAATNTRQIPDLLKPDYSITNGGSSLHTRQDGAVTGPSNSNKAFSRIPELYPIQRYNITPTPSNYFNGMGSGSGSYQQHQQQHRKQPLSNGRYVAGGGVGVASGDNQPTHRSGLPPVLPSLSHAQLFQSYLKQPVHVPTSKVIANHVMASHRAEDEKTKYSRLLNFIPFMQTKSKTIDNNKQRPIETVDLSLENDYSKTSIASITSNTSSVSSMVEPVNSLREKYMHRDVVRDGWESNLHQQYRERKSNNAELVRKEKAKTSAAESASKELEEKIIQKLKKVELDTSSFVYESKEEEEEVNDFPTISKEQFEDIKRFMYGRDNGQPIITKFNISIKRCDVQTLRWEPLEWLNDEVINFYMELIADRCTKNENLPRVYCMNTFFLQRLLENGYAGVRRWTRKVDIFSYDVIMIPVHKKIHWCMAIVHFKQKAIRFYDSMGAPDNMVLNALESYLEQESLDKKKATFDKTGWTKENMRGIPQQDNGSDCGVFSCMFAEFVSRNRPIVFTQKDMEYFRQRMVYEICTGQLLAQ